MRTRNVYEQYELELLQRLVQERNPFTSQDWEILAIDFNQESRSFHPELFFPRKGKTLQGRYAKLKKDELLVSLVEEDKDEEETDPPDSGTLVSESLESVDNIPPVQVDLSSFATLHKAATKRSQNSPITPQTNKKQKASFKGHPGPSLITPPKPKAVFLHNVANPPQSICSLPSPEISQISRPQVNNNKIKDEPIWFKLWAEIRNDDLQREEQRRREERDRDDRRFEQMLGFLKILLPSRSVASSDSFLPLQPIMSPNAQLTNARGNNEDYSDHSTHMSKTNDHMNSSIFFRQKNWLEVVEERERNDHED